MGLDFEAVGRSRAVPDLLNRLRQDRQDVAAEQLAGATEIRAQAGEERAQGRFESDTESAGLTRDKLRQEMNIQANKEKDLAAQRVRMNKVQTFEELQKKDPFTAQMMLDSGNVQIVNGEQVVTGRDAADFYKTTGKTQKFKEDRIQFAKEQTVQQVAALDQQLAEMKPTDKTRPEVQAQRDQMAKQGDTYREMQIAMRDATVEQAKTFTGESLEKFKQSGNLGDLVKRKSDAQIKAEAAAGKGTGLKAADINALSKLNHSIRGGTFAADGSLNPLNKDLQNEKASADEEAARLMQSGEAKNLMQAIAMANRNLGYKVKNVNKDMLKKAQEGDAPAAAGGDFTKDNPATPKTAAEFKKLPPGSVYTDPEDGKLYTK